MIDTPIKGFELSPAQERLYFIAEGRSEFQCQSAVLLTGALDISRLQAAVESVVGRYEILRTNFRLLAGRRRILQVVQPAAPTALEAVDLSGSGNPDAEIDRILRETRDVPFDRERGALTRIKLVSIGENRHVLILGISSLCADARSLGILIEELAGQYEGSVETSGELLQYADFSAWQRELLESDDDDARDARTFWSNQAAMGSSLARLPYERRAAPEGRFHPGSQTVALTGTFPTSSREFWLACWIGLISRLTHHEQGIVGVVAEGRTIDELGRAVGLIAKTIPLAWQAALAHPFSRLVGQCKDSLEEAESRMEYYASKSDSGSTGPLEFPLGFTWQTSFSRRTAADVEFSLLKLYSCVNPFGLNLICTASDGRVGVEIQYDTNRFAQVDMERMAEQFSLLALGARDSATLKIGELPLLPEAERNQLIVEWNSTESHFPAGSCIHTLIEQQADRTPNATALVCADEKLTFSELNSKANRIAHCLKQQGVGRYQPVALCVDRSADMIVGLLAVLKAGGFYVPLAADLPAARLSAFLDQSCARLALIQSPLGDKFTDWNGTLISLDTNVDEWNAFPESNPDLVNTPEDTAYVIFTSGSTGVPKGVVCRHLGLVNYTTFITGTVNVHDCNREQIHWGSVSTLSADLGNTAVFPSLASGGCLHLIQYETAMDGERFARYVLSNPLDVLKITPSHLRALLASSESAILPDSCLFIGGEALTWDLLELVRNRGACDVVNHYGPTETTIGSLTCTAVSNGAIGDIRIADSETVPIGRPIANTRIYILDDRGEQVPIGISGELYIGGAGVAAGYWNQPELTAERFLPDPFVAGAKLYRTGDRARYLANGAVEFLGRVDDQVKIRGFRVEPGEVESVMLQHPDVRAAAVLANDDNHGGKLLIGFYCAGQSPIVDELRRYLAENLPEHMIPSTLTLMPELPLTANGKIDRKALASLETSSHSPAYEAPRTATEEQLAEIWARILKIDRAGIHEDFFELGGHSLLMTQVLARIRSVFQVQLDLYTLFDHPTIAALAVVIDNEYTTGSTEDEMSKLLAELEGLTDEEAMRLLIEEASE